MKDTKRRLELFSFFEHTGIEKHLEKMAANGWMLEKITGALWYYRRIESKKVHFKVTYYPNASEFDPEPSEGEQTFREFCEHTGWVAAASSAQMIIFYNEQENPTPIETDPMLEVETIHKAAKKNFLPSMILILICGLLNGAMNLTTFFSDPVQWLSRMSSQVSGTAMLLMVLLCSVQMGSYFCWRRKALRAAKQGEFLETKSTVTFQKIILALALADMAYYLISVFVSTSSGIFKTFSLIALVWVFALIVIVNGIKNYLKRKKVSAKKNRIITLTADFLLAFFFVGCFSYFAFQAARTGLFEPDVETYEYNGMMFPVYSDELLLTVEDLLGITSENYMKEKRDDASMFLGQLHMNQYPRLDADDFLELPSLEYTITVVKMPFLHDFCKDALLKKHDGTDEVFGEFYEAVDAESWGAKEVYQLMSPEYGPWNRYLICYEDRFIELEADWEMTEEQMVIAGEKLRK